MNKHSSLKPVRDLIKIVRGTYEHACIGNVCKVATPNFCNGLKKGGTNSAAETKCMDWRREIVQA